VLMYRVIINTKPGGNARPEYKVGGPGMCAKRAATRAMQLFEFEHGADLACDLNNGDATVSVDVIDERGRKSTFEVGAETRFWYTAEEVK
jgi:hypothetical protein